MKPAPESTGSRRCLLASLLSAVVFAVCPHVGAASDFITLASTTSTEQSGLFRHLLPLFKESSGIEVRVVALGSGQALDLARRGDADVVLAHSPGDEERFVSEGHGLARVPVMYNEYLIVGPADDPAGIAGAENSAEVMKRLLAGSAPFISRGDRSGTHVAELALWTLADIKIDEVKGPWYRETGQGMGPALNMASAMDAYLLADRGTWISFKNRGNLNTLFEGTAELRNPYSAILVNPEKHPHVKAQAARRFVDWLVSSEGREAIASFRIEDEVLFHPAERP